MSILGPVLKEGHIAGGCNARDERPGPPAETSNLGKRLDEYSRLLSS